MAAGVRRLADRQKRHERCDLTLDQRDLLPTSHWNSLLLATSPNWLPRETDQAPRRLALRRRRRLLRELPRQPRALRRWTARRRRPVLSL